MINYSFDSEQRIRQRFVMCFWLFNICVDKNIRNYYGKVMSVLVGEFEYTVWVFHRLCEIMNMALKINVSKIQVVMFKEEKSGFFSGHVNSEKNRWMLCLHLWMENANTGRRIVSRCGLLWVTNICWGKKTGCA